MNRTDATLAAELVRALLGAVERGELDASRAERRDLSRAALALDQMASRAALASRNPDTTRDLRSRRIRGIRT